MVQPECVNKEYNHLKRYYVAYRDVFISDERQLCLHIADTRVYIEYIVRHTSELMRVRLEILLNCI